MFNLFKSVESFLETVDQQAAVISTPDSKKEAGQKDARTAERAPRSAITVVAPEPIRAIQSPTSIESKKSLTPVQVEDSAFGDDWSQKQTGEMEDWNNDDFGDSSDWTHTPSKLNASHEPISSKATQKTASAQEWSSKEAPKNDSDLWAQDDDWRSSVATIQDLPAKRVASAAEIPSSSPATLVNSDQVRSSPSVSVPEFGEWDFDASAPQDANNAQDVAYRASPMQQSVDSISNPQKDSFADSEWDFDSPVVFQHTVATHPLPRGDLATELDFGDSERSPLDFPRGSPSETSKKSDSDPEAIAEADLEEEPVVDQTSPIAPVDIPPQASDPHIWDDKDDDELFGPSEWDSSAPLFEKTSISENPPSEPSAFVPLDLSSASHFDSEPSSISPGEDSSETQLEAAVEETLHLPDFGPAIDHQPSSPQSVESSTREDLFDADPQNEAPSEDAAQSEISFSQEVVSSPLNLSASSSKIDRTASTASLSQSQSTPIEEGKEALRRLSMVQSKLKEQSKQIGQLTEEKLALEAQLKQRELELKAQLKKALDRVATFESQSQARQNSDSSISAAQQAEIERLKEEHKANQEAVVSHLTAQVNRYAKLNDELQSRYEEKKTQLVAMLEEKKRNVVSLETQISELKAEYQRSEQDSKQKVVEERRKVEEKWTKERKELEEASQKKETILNTRLDAALASIAKKDDQIKSLEHENGILAGEVSIRKTGEAEEAKRAWELKETLEHSIEHSTAQLQAQIQELHAQRDLMAQEHATLQTQLAKAHAKSERSIAALQAQLDERLDLYTQLDSEYAEYKTRAASHLKQLENQLELEKRQSSPTLGLRSDSSLPSSLVADHTPVERDALKAPAAKLLDLVNSGSLVSLSPSIAQNMKEIVSEILSPEDSLTVDSDEKQSHSIAFTTLISLFTILTDLLSESQAHTSRLHLELEEAKAETPSLQTSMPVLVEPLQIQVNRLQEDLNMSEEKIEHLERVITSLQAEIDGHLQTQRSTDQTLKDLEKSGDLKLLAKDEEIGKLKRQLAARMAASTAQTELESRVKYMSDQLIAKQLTIDSMEAERRSYEEWQSGTPGTASKPKRNEKRVSSSSASMDAQTGDTSYIDFSGNEEDDQGDIESQGEPSTLLGASGNLLNSSNPFQASSFSEARSRIISRAKSVGRNVSSKLNANPIARKIASFFPRSVPAQVILFSYLAFLQLLVFYLMSSSSSSAATASDTLLPEKKD
jgi:hypothetical protein